MEYSEIFNVTKQMHLRSYSEVVGAFEHARKKCKKLEILIHNLESGESVSAESILGMTMNHIGHPGSQIEITAKAKSSEEPLKKYVQEIGRLFTLDAGVD
jgi:phosphotransferase system HPr-like phosphotransfer protein